MGMNEPRNERLENILASIHRHERFLIATHVRPDGDAIGSLLALTFMLRRLGKTADPFCQDMTPSGQEFLPGVESISHRILQPSLYEVAILVDCGDLMRVGESLVGSIRSIPLLINIDHHISGEPFGDIYWLEPGASSTCEMLYDLSLVLPLDLDNQIATQLYTGLITDTGSFRFANTSKRVLEIAAVLVSAGAKPAYIAGQIYDSLSPQTLRLLSMMLSTLAFHVDGRLATAELTQKMFVETTSSPADSEGFINHLRSVKSVELAMLFREDENGVVHVSMRSKGNADVATFARRFGGGGHQHAAAFRVSGAMDEIRSRCTEEAILYLERSGGEESASKAAMR
jgi:phosphoesterase RecJ-like protein